MITHISKKTLLLHTLCIDERSSDDESTLRSDLSSLRSATMITYLAREKIVNRKVVDNLFKRTSKIFNNDEHGGKLK